MCGGTGSGKTLLGVEFLARGARQFGEPGVMFSFEESAQDIADNVASLGFDLPALEDAGLLLVDQVATGGADLTEAGAYDLDGLFIRLGYAVETVGARRVVLDTIEAAFGIFSNEATLRTEIRRLFSWLDKRGITTIVTGERGAGTLTRHGIEEYASDCIILLDQRVERQATTGQVAGQALGNHAAHGFEQVEDDLALPARGEAVAAQ